MDLKIEFLLWSAIFLIYTFEMSTPRNHNPFRLGAAKLKTLSMSQTGSAIQTKEKGKHKLLVYHHEKKKERSRSYD